MISIHVTCPFGLRLASTHLNIYGKMPESGPIYSSFAEYLELSPAGYRLVGYSRTESLALGRLSIRGQLKIQPKFNSHTCHRTIQVMNRVENITLCISKWDIKAIAGNSLVGCDRSISSYTGYKPSKPCPPGPSCWVNIKLNNTRMMILYLGTKVRLIRCWEGRKGARMGGCSLHY